MRFVGAPPKVDLWIEVDPEELEAPWMKQGLKIPFTAKNGETVYYWRVQGVWILVTVKQDLKLLIER